MPSAAHRGGWSTSICDLFTDSRQRSSCCAIACCGLLLSDRNAHFALHEQRPSWWKRFCWNVGLPVSLLLFLNILETFLATSDNVYIWDLSILLTMIVVVMFLLYRARLERTRVRRAVMKKMLEYEAENIGREQDDHFLFSADTHLQLHAHDIRMAHATCSCYPVDVANIVTTSTGDAPQNDGDDDVSRGHASTSSDLCTCLWRTIRCLCCGWLCGCWCQLCGMCAIGQEDREIQRLLDKQLLQVDYVTFQPYTDYYPAIQALRAAHDGSLMRHWRALSLLSYNLVKIFATCLAVLTFVAVLELDPKFQVQNLVIVLATFAQAFIILYFCHWQWHRFDLSIDALVKYFASGFILCTFLAIIYEVLVSWVLGIISYTVVIASIYNEIATASTPEEVKQVAEDFAKSHMGIYSVFVFLNAFIVAALVEEMCKYFGYWMVETPDLLSTDEFVLETIEESSLQQPSPQQQLSAAPKRSLVSQGAGITIGMVAVAAGFACSENLLYVFIYTPPGVTNEIATLVARSMFPIHPLCAAIQSIGVVRRDLEKNSNWKLGWILLPAIVLHGSFDFLLMYLALVESSGKTKSTATSGTDDSTFSDLDQGDTIPLILSVSIVVLGLLYFGCESLNQRRRLEALDTESQTVAQNLV